MYYVGRFGQTWRQPPPAQSKAVVFSSVPGDFVLVADAGSYSLTGQAATLIYDRVAGADTGAYTLTGQAANLEHHRVLPALTGTYVLTGQDATLTVARLIFLDAEAGSYTLTGQSVTFTRTPRDCPAMSITVTPEGAMSTRRWPRC